MLWLSEPCVLAQLLVTSRSLQDGSVPWGRAACCRDSLLVALPFLCFTRSPAVSRSSPCSFTAFALSVCSSPPSAPWLCACLPSPGCVRVFLTDCAISVCPYLSLTRTTKQRYAHLFFHRVCLLLSHLSLPWEGSGAEHPAAGSVPSAGTEPWPCLGLCSGQQGCCALPPPGVVKTWPAVLAEQVRGALRGQPGIWGQAAGLLRWRELSGEVGRVAKPPAAEQRVPGEAQGEQRPGAALGSLGRG